MRFRIRFLCTLAGAALLLVGLPTMAEAASANPPSVAFGSIPINTTATQDVTITVDADYRAEIASGSGINVPFGFNFDTCGAGGGFTGPGTCNVKQSFTPTAITSSSGTTTVFECPVLGGSCIGIPIAVSGSGVSTASANPASVAFGSVPINTTATRDVTITVDAGYRAEIASGTGINVPFGFDFDTCGAGGGFTGPGTCNVKQSFTPTAITSSSGTTTVFECPVLGGSCIGIPIAVSGSGVSTASANPASVAFGNVPINTTATRDVTITVDAGYRAEIASGTGINAPFGFNFDTCGAGGGFTGPGTCNVKQSFTPTAITSSSGTTTVFECPVLGGSCIGIPIAVSGSGVSMATASPASLDYGTVLIGTGSTRSVTLTIDAGYRAELGSGSGLNPPFTFDFDGCGAGGGFTGPGTCNINETFTPTVAGAASGTLNVFECPVAGGGCIAIPVSLQGVGVDVLTITTAALPGGTVGVPYVGATLQSSGGTAPVTWSVTAGALPPGLTLNPATGAISGTPNGSGVFNFTVTATDSGAPTPQTATKDLSISVVGVADLAVSIAGPAKPIPFPKPVILTIVVQNLGPDSAGAVLTEPLPSGSAFVSAVTDRGSCVTPPAGSTGTMVCILGTLAAGTGVTITVVLEATVKKATMSTTATVTPDAGTIDPVPANNTASISVRIR